VITFYKTLISRELAGDEEMKKKGRPEDGVAG